MSAISQAWFTFNEIYHYNLWVFRLLTVMHLIILGGYPVQALLGEAQSDEAFKLAIKLANGSYQDRTLCMFLRLPYVLCDIEYPKI